MKQTKKCLYALLCVMLCAGMLFPLGSVGFAAVPETKGEILELYRSAVNKVRSGAAGYTKKAWQTVPELNLIGNPSADAVMRDIVGNYIRSEADAPEDRFAFGSKDAQTQIPACTLTDLSKIREASCAVVDGNYSIRITLTDETSPVPKENSFLGQITDNFLTKADIDKELSGISVLSEYDYDLVYREFTVSAVITPAGEFKSVQHHANVEIDIHSVTIVAVIKVIDKSVTMTADVSYYSFDYGNGGQPGFVLPGDVSQDGNVTAEDARLALRLAVGLEQFSPASAQFTAADYDESGEVTAADARAILRLAVGLDPTDTPTEPLPPEEPLPQPSAEVAALAEQYRGAIEKTRSLGAGFTTQTWQTVPELNLTGNAVVDNFINSEVVKRIHPADHPQGWTYEKETADAAAHIPPFSLTDLSRVRSAKSEQKNGNTEITLIMADETDPRGGESFLGQVTDDIVFREDIDAALPGISFLAANPDYHVTYKNLTLIAEIAPDGTLVRLHHHVQAEIRVNEAVLLVVPLRNQSVTMESDILYYDFTY